ncbi:MAG: hypothetical protein R2932_59390 [Caldilineaceae bacterium]
MKVRIIILWLVTLGVLGFAPMASMAREALIRLQDTDPARAGAGRPALVDQGDYMDLRYKSPPIWIQKELP